jgi:hypothetical protein
MKFSKVADGEYEVRDGHLLVGRVRRLTDRTPVCAPGVRYSYATQVQTRWVFAIDKSHSDACPQYGDRHSVGYSFATRAAAADAMAGRLAFQWNRMV